MARAPALVLLAVLPLAGCLEEPLPGYEVIPSEVRDTANVLVWIDNWSGQEMWRRVEVLGEDGTVLGTTTASLSKGRNYHAASYDIERIHDIKAWVDPDGPQGPEAASGVGMPAHHCQDDAWIEWRVVYGDGFGPEPVRCGAGQPPWR